MLYTSCTQEGMYILGIHDHHNATAVLLKDGKIIAAASEERFTRVKNQEGFPIKSLEYLLTYANIKGKDIDLMVLAGTSLFPYLGESLKSRLGSSINSSTKFGSWGVRKKIFYYLHSLLLFLEYKLTHSETWQQFYKNTPFFLIERYFGRLINENISQLAGVPLSKIIRVDHHSAHACAALYSSPFARKKSNTLIFTCDGCGDGLSATVSTYQRQKIHQIVKIPVMNSLGMFYSYITMHLGMKPLEHEYKVMGLAPYSTGEGKNLVYKILAPLIAVDEKELNIKTKINSELFGIYFQNHLPHLRFDFIAAAAQQVTEEVLTTWIQSTIQKYKIGTIACGGGVFMNVKANQKIAELPEVNEVFFMPSGGDESIAMGAAYWGFRKLTNKIPFPIKDLYLGPSFSKKEIKDAIKNNNLKEKYKVRRYTNIEKKIAKLLAKEEVVARFAGRMEWGARALGNRSILADASKIEVKDQINKMIKNRDFWMPFAPVILGEELKGYVINPKNIEAPFMIITFDSTKEGQKDLKAAMHPYDKTLRPQVIDKETNEGYYKILIEFKKITRKKGLLNTSFNIHGEPIVCSPEDAISTFERSGLKYLAIEDYLIEKRLP